MLYSFDNVIVISLLELICNTCIGGDSKTADID